MLTLLSVLSASFITVTEKPRATVLEAPPLLELCGRDAGSPHDFVSLRPSASSVLT